MGERKPRSRTAGARADPADVDKLEEAVLSYCATVQTSAASLTLPKFSNSGMAAACLYSMTGDELSVATAMRDKILKVGESVVRLENGAAERGTKRAADYDAGNPDKQYFADLYGAPAGDARNIPGAAAAMQQLMQDQANMLDAQRKVLVLRSLAKSVEARLDALVASLNGSIEILGTNTLPFRLLAVQCQDWTVTMQPGAR